MTTKNKSKSQNQTKPSRETLVQEHLSEQRLSALASQPGCIGNGGITKVVSTACNATINYPQPLRAAVVLTLQLCGSKPKPEDLKLTE